jgi:TonB family protein
MNTVSSPASPILPSKFPLEVGIPVIASIAIHGAILGLAFPGLTSFSQNKDDFTPASSRPRSVGVVELNAADQTRLPNLAPNIPEIPNIPAVNSPPLDSSSVQTPPLPNSVNSLNTIPSPPSLPSLPSLPYNNNIPLAISPNSFPRSFAPRAYLPPPPPNQPLAQPGLNSNPANPQNVPNQTQRPNFPPLKEPIPAQDLINQKPYIPLPEQNQAQQQVATNSGNPIPTQQQRTNPSEYQGLNNYIDWMRKNGGIQEGQNPRNIPQISMAGNYPGNVSQTVGGTAVYGVVVNSQGQVINAYPIKSSGSPILDRQALQQIKSQTFTNQGERLLVRVNFGKDSEPSYPINLPKPKPTGSSQPSQPVKPSPQASPEAPTVLREAPTTPEVPTISPSPQPKPEASPTAPTSLKKAPRTPEVPTSPQVSPEASPMAPAAPKKAPPTTQVQTPLQPNPQASPSAVASPQPASESAPLGSIAPKKPSETAAESAPTPQGVNSSE